MYTAHMTVVERKVVLRTTFAVLMQVCASPVSVGGSGRSIGIKLVMLLSQVSAHLTGRWPRDRGPESDRYQFA